MKNLLTAIYGKTVGSTLSTSVGGRIFIDEAGGDQVEYPYIVFYLISNNPEYPGGKTMDGALVQFSIFSKSKSAVEISTILSYLRSLFDDCSLTITDNTLVYFIRGNLSTMFDYVDVPGGVGVRHYAQEYEISMVR